jgi:hypothetical protein
MLMRASAACVLFALLCWAACSPPPDPITVAENTVVLLNQTSRDWTNVRITVNDHFTGGTPRLAAGGRLTAPLREMQTAFGQRYDVTRQLVYKIEVTATDSKGDAVNLRWLAGRGSAGSVQVR